MISYESLGAPPALNAAGFATRLGGALMRPEVVAAMNTAALSSVDIATLQGRASKVIANATGAEAGLVTSGATAALQLAAAAVIAGLDIAVMNDLPDVGDHPCEIVMLRTHRTGYDHGLRAAGARIVDAGSNTRGMEAGGRKVEPWEVESVIGPRTVAIAATATPTNSDEILVLGGVAEGAGIPLIVDAAAQLPPRENLRRFFELGATVVAFSGGKALRGPQTTGILAGSRDLIMSAALQMLDMDEMSETWIPSTDLIDIERLPGVPHHGIGRGLKVSKENVIGLLTALELFVAGSEEGEVRARIIDEIEKGLLSIEGLRATQFSTRWGWPRLQLELVGPCAVSTLAELSRALKTRPRPVYLNEQRLSEGVLEIDPGNLGQEDVPELVGALLEECRTESGGEK